MSPSSASQFRWEVGSLLALTKVPLCPGPRLGKGKDGQI
jgi:hypothetical protein